MKKRTTKIIAGGMALALVLGSLLAFAGMAGAMAEPGVSDIDYSSNKQAIEGLMQKGIVSGYDDGTYRPDATVNRAEFMKIVVGSLDVDTTGEGNCFPDVTDQWFAPYVCYGAVNGIVNGYDDGTFKPEREVNYAEALKMTYLAYGDQGNADASGQWYMQYADDAKENDVFMYGISYDKALTRGEMAQLMYNYMYQKEHAFGDGEEQNQNNNPNTDDSSEDTSSDVCQVGVDCVEQESSSSSSNNTSGSNDPIYVVYTDSDYDFDLTFDTSWEGLKTTTTPVNLGTTTVAVIKFQLPDKWNEVFPNGTNLDPTLLAITVREKAWKNDAAENLLDTIIGEDGQYVYTWTSNYAASSPDSAFDLASIIKTFKLN